MHDVTQKIHSLDKFKCYIKEYLLKHTWGFYFSSSSRFSNVVIKSLFLFLIRIKILLAL